MPGVPPHSQRAARPEKRAWPGPPLEGRPQIEKDLETGESCALLPQRANLASWSIARTGNRNNKRRTIELIAEIDANRTHRRLISHPHTQSVRKISELIGAIRGAHWHVRRPGRWGGVFQCGGELRPDGVQLAEAQLAIRMTFVIEHAAARSEFEDL